RVMDNKNDNATVDKLSLEQFLAAENAKLRKAGCKMAEAALHVVGKYDGLHRLMLAVSEWARVLADEGGRGRYNTPSSLAEAFRICDEVEEQAIRAQKEFIDKEAGFFPPWPCQHLYGGRPPFIYQGCDPDTGLCHHPECNPENDDRKKGASDGKTEEAD
ncbi:MAG: hypothetical protein KJ888_21110, partial [Gammaproteobacteria bacterium]|nr:hypothetical protein [Gammaproteobacteria bacterium]